MSNIQMENEMLSAFTAMTASLKQLVSQGVHATKGAGGAGVGGRTRTQDDVQVEKFEREERLGIQSMRKNNKALKDLVKATKSFSATTAAANAGLAGLADRHRAAFKGMQHHEDVLDSLTQSYSRLARHTLPAQQRAADHLVRGTGLLSNNVSKNARAQSLMSAAMLKRAETLDQDDTSIEHARFISKLTSSFDDTDAMLFSMMKTTKMVDEAGETFADIKEAVNLDDFARLRALIGESTVRIAESLDSVAGLDIGQLIDGKINLSDIVGVTGDPRDSDTMRTSLVAASVSLREAGIDFGEGLNKSIDILTNKSGTETDDAIAAANADLLSTNSKDLAKTIDALIRTNKKAVPIFDSAAVSVNSFAGKMSRFVNGGAMDRFTSQLASAASTGAAMGKLWDSTKAIFKQTQDFNVANVGIGYWAALKESANYGMNFEDTIKFMQDNKRMMARFGEDTFSTMRGGFEDTFNDFGMTFAQGASALAPMTEAAILAGVDQSSSDAINAYMMKTLKGFQSMAAMVNVTAEEYARLNVELYSAPEIMGNLLGMSSEQSEVYAKSLEKQREELVTRGLGLQQAQEMVKAQEAAKRSKVMDRVRESGQALGRAMLVGMDSGQAMKMHNLKLKGTRRTDPENTQYAALNDELARKSAIYLNALRTAGDTQGLVGEMGLQMTEAMGTDQANAEERIRVDKANAGLTAEQKKEQQEKAKGSPTIATAGEIINTTASLLGNEFTKAIWSATTALAGLTLSAGLGGVGGKLGKLKGVGGRVLGGAKSLMGTGLGKAGTVAGGARTVATQAATRGASLLTGSLSTGGITAAGGGTAVAGTAAAAAMSAAAAAAAGYAGWKIGGVINDQLEKADISLGSMVYDGVDAMKGWFGNSDADKMAALMPAIKATPTVTVPTGMSKDAPESKPVAEPLNKPAINQLTDDGALRVSDSGSQAHLLKLTQQMEMVLQAVDLFVTSQPTKLLVNRDRLSVPVHTAPAYLTGRK